MGVLSMGYQIGVGRADFSEIDMTRPVSLKTTQLDGMDPTEAIPDGEVFVVRQVDEDGRCHTLVLSEKMVIELMRLMNAWITFEIAA